MTLKHHFGFWIDALGGAVDDCEEARDTLVKACADGVARTSCGGMLRARAYRMNILR